MEAGAMLWKKGSFGARAMLIKAKSSGAGATAMFIKRKALEPEKFNFYEGFTALVF